MTTFRFMPQNPVLFIPFFVLGTAIYRGRSDIGTAQDRCQAFVAFILSCCCIVGFAYHFGQPPVLPRNLLEIMRDGEFNATFRTAQPWLAFYAVTLGTFLVVSRVRLSGWLRTLDTAAGDITYPFYLIHIPVVSWMLYPSPIWSQPQYTAIVYLVCCVAAYILHRTIEQPMAALRRRIREGTPRHDAETVAAMTKRQA